MSVHKVQRGQTLWSISKHLAQERGDVATPSAVQKLIENIKDINGLKGDMILPDQELTLPEIARANDSLYNPRNKPQQQVVHPDKPALQGSVFATDEVGGQIEDPETGGIRHSLDVLGFDPVRSGSRDHDSDHSLRQAIKKWQAHNYYEADGKLTPTQVKELQLQAEMKEIVSRKSDIPVPSQNEVPDIDRIRTNILDNVRQYMGKVEQDGNNRGPMIRTFLRSSLFEAGQRDGAAPEGAPWCAAVASHVLSNVLPDALGYSVSAKGLLHEAAKIGAYHKIGHYAPQPGDLIFFERGRTGDARGHVGFVESVDPDGTIHTIEGNVKVAKDARNKGPDGIGHLSYSPSEFSRKRILGFADLTVVAENSIREMSSPTRVASNSFESLRIPSLSNGI